MNIQLILILLISILYLIVVLLLLFFPNLFPGLTNPMRYLFIGLISIYLVFRIWRGFSNKQNEND